MEAELRRIGEHLTKESISAIEKADSNSDIKRLYEGAFARASACFALPNSYSECFKCGEEALASMKAHKTATNQVLRAMQRRFKTCIAACGMNQQSYLSDDLKACMRKCEERAVEEIQEAVPEIRALARPRN